VPLKALATPSAKAEGPGLSEACSLEDALLSMLAAGATSATALGPGGEVVGTVTADRIVTAATAAPAA